LNEAMSYKLDVIQIGSAHWNSQQEKS